MAELPYPRQSWVKHNHTFIYRLDTKVTVHEFKWINNNWIILVLHIILVLLLTMNVNPTPTRWGFSTIGILHFSFFIIILLVQFSSLTIFCGAQDVCEPEEEQSSLTLTTEEILKYKLWAHFDPGVRYEGDTMYGFDAGFRALYEHQNPEDCSKAQFMIGPGHGEGFGSNIHIETIHLTIAINTKRVLLRDPLGYHERGDNKVAFCTDQGDPRALYTMECYYEPWSKCTIEDIFPDFYSKSYGEMVQLRDSIKWATGNYKEIMLGGEEVIANSERLMNERAVRLPAITDTIWITPTVEPWYKLVQCRIQYEKAARKKDLPRNFPHIWYATAAAYLVRPNQVVLEKLDEYKRNVSLNKIKDRRFDKSADILPFYPYNNTDDFAKRPAISIFMRHGDKYREMQLVDEVEYENVAEWILKNNRITKRVQISETDGTIIREINTTTDKTIYFATEDPFALPRVVDWANTTGWLLYYTNLFNRLSVEAGEAAGKGESDPLEYLSMLLNLDMSFDCTSWICTLKSNSCQLMNELRATIARKADLPFLDLNRKDWFNY